MLQYVNTVLVGKDQPTSLASASITNVNPGDIVMSDEFGKFITTSADAAKASIVKIGLVTGETLDYTDPLGVAKSIKKIQWSNEINKQTIRTFNEFSYSPLVEDVINIDFGTFQPVLGRRYVLRIVYRDLYEHPGQFTHSYEVIANSNIATTAQLMEAFRARINAHAGKRVIATIAGSILTLTAKPKTGMLTEGKEAITLFSRVQMEAFMWYTDPSGVGFSSRNKYILDGVTITTIPGTNGKGNPMIIRDREQAALAYKGITFRTHWPVIKPELNVQLDKKYDGFVLEFENQHRTAEDDFRQTKQSVEMYVTNGAAIATTAIYKLTKSFVTGTAVA